MLTLLDRFFGAILLLWVAGAVCPGASAAIRDGGIDPANLGKGDWIYYMSMATNKLGGNVPTVNDEHSLMRHYTNHGIRYIIIKAATDDYLFNGSYSTPQFNSRLVNIAHTYGLLIFGYNRSYGRNVAGEIAISDYVFNQGADGFVWDAESEWESNQTWIGTNGPALAWQLCSAVRSNWPTKFLAHAPFPIISYHSSFPYKEFGYWCDAVMPQIYYFGWTGVKGRPSGGVNWSDVNWQNWQTSLAGLPPANLGGLTVYWTNAIKPLAPVCQVYGPNPPNSAVSELAPEMVMEFVDYLVADPHAVTPGGYQGASFWRTDLHGSAQWANIKLSTIGRFPSIVNNIVLDSPGTVTAGDWTSIRTFSNGRFSGDGSGMDTNSFGTNYLIKAQGAGAAYVQFTPDIVVPGDYDVYQFHPRVEAASASVPHLIHHHDGSTTVYANQQTNAGKWSWLGRFNFDTGTAGSIRVLDDVAESDKVAIADGVKLVFATPTSVPATPTGLAATAVSTSRVDLVWTDAATNETGYLVARGTQSGGPYTQVTVLPRNSTHYSDTGLAESTAYFYVVRATNWLGASPNSAQANAVTLGPPQPPAITAQPGSRLVIAGQDAAFTVTATGSWPLSYQWRFNGANIPGATNSGYTRANPQAADAGLYSVVVANSLGTVTSSNAVLTVHFLLTTRSTVGGTVSASPDLASYAPGALVTLSAAPETGYAFFAWSGDATGSNNPLSLAMTSHKSVTATFLSTNTDLILDNPDPLVSFAGDWTNGTMSTDKYGEDYCFIKGAAQGAAQANYRPPIGLPGYYNVSVWYPEGSNRATNAPWSVTYDGGSTNVAVNQTDNGGGWRLIAGPVPFARGTSGCVRLSNNTGDSNKVVIADAVRFSYIGPVPTAPAITVPPQDLTVLQGSDATFTVTATGTAPLRYQWYFNGTSISGATGASYTRSQVQTNHAGNYSVIVTNVAGRAISAATLRVTVPQPAWFRSVEQLPDGSTKLVVAGDAGATYVLEVSSDLSGWTPWRTNFNLNGTFEIIDHDTTLPQRFYRARH